MVEPVERSVPGHAGALAARIWPLRAPRGLVVIVPGLADHAGRYGPVAAALGAAGAEVVGYDPAGQGRSAGERAVTDFEDAVGDLRAMLADAGTRHPGLPVVLLGHGLGGAVVVRYAQRYPDGVTALVLVAPVLGYWETLDLLSERDFPEVPVDPAALTRDEGEQAAFAADPLASHVGPPRATLAAAEEFLRTIDFDHPLGDDLPALWLHGEDDPLVSLADTRAGLDRVRGLRFAERGYPGARHDLWHETNAGEVLADLTAFVTDTLRA